MAEVQTTSLSGEMAQRFIEFVMLQSQNAALFLGQFPHPHTGETEVNLDAARMFIDQLEMIQEKTRGNLSSDESRVIGNALTSLRMAYVEVSRGGGEPPAEHEPAPVAVEPPEVEQSAPAESIASTEAPSDSRKKFTKSYGA
ncbi:MAG TPA: DUF1844 domain-containing protein [Chthoniobacterales bacterium]